MLPDIVLLEIFDSYLEKAWIEQWGTLVHVCQSWRNLVFGSPRRLNLRLCCDAETPVRKSLDVWPLLPIIVLIYSLEEWGGAYGEDSIIAALEQNDRICEICLSPGLPLAVLAAMQRPFPELTRLELKDGFESSPVIPASLLGGSAPRLQKLTLDCVQFPELPKLLLSTTHLAKLELTSIPYSGYISPEEMVSGFSALSLLESLVIGFRYSQFPPHQKSRRPQTRTLLPVLAELSFKGACVYLEDLVAWIDAPLLDNMTIIFFHQPIFDTPHLNQFITRTSKFKTLNEARVVFTDDDVQVNLPQSDGPLYLRILCDRQDWQLSSLVQVCSSSFPQAFMTAVEHLYILRRAFWGWSEDIENSQWLKFFYPFTAVKDLYISRGFVPRITLALQELVGERVTEVLPVLQSLHLEEPHQSGPVQEAIGRFVAARQLVGHPIAVTRWKRK